MKKYIVKSGQNIFDVALAIYGSIEGVFDLLISNESQSLSFDTILSPGTSLDYNENYTIYSNIRDWFANNNIKVANGEHIYSHIDMREYIINYIADHNDKVVNDAMKLYPNVWNPKNEIQQANSMQVYANFALYIREHYFGFGTSDVEKFANNILKIEETESSADQERFFNSTLTRKRMIIKQSGYLSSFSAKLNGTSVIAIDWGDFSQPTISINTDTKYIFDHCYEDEGKHTIAIYGNFVFESLDLSNINGIYYPTSTIKVLKSFNSKLLDNKTINNLISVINE